MRIAYLVLCHKNPEQVAVLLARLSGENADCYVHVDKKVASFVLPASEHVFVLPRERSVDVRWAAKSMVMATLETIDYMFESGKKYDYVFLISGQDFPIKNNIEIQKHLEKAHGANFIEVLQHTDPLYTRYSKRNAISYPAWMLRRSVWVKVIKKLYIYLSGGYNRTFSLFRRKNTTGLTFEFGSQWWCLTYDCLLWIRNYIAEHSEVLTFFDHALVPDECLFQTVFMASPYKEQREGKLTFVEWDVNGNNPRILTKDDFVKLSETSFLFARKFDFDIDRDIVDMMKDIKGN